jgi:5-methyltetrahydrofolate--homocysteine methyltransferase
MSFTELLQQRRLLADGAMGTELQQRGLPLYTPADQWSLSHPDIVLALHQAYVAAGSEMVLTNSMSANGSNYPSETVVAINRAAVTIARQGGARWVAGSMGPGADEVQIGALADAGVDLLWLETQLSLVQVLNSIAACRRTAPNLPLIVTFSFHHPTPTTHTGETIAEIAKTVSEFEISAIGANCGNGLKNLSTIIEQFTRYTSLPLVLKPNAGIPVLENNYPIYRLSPQEWCTQLTTLLTPRVCIVGGCCGTTPEHLRLLHKNLI